MYRRATLVIAGILGLLAFIVMVNTGSSPSSPMALAQPGPDSSAATG